MTANGFERMRIANGSGFVGIGVTAPIAPLEISNTGDIAYLDLNTTAGNKRTRINFSQNGVQRMEIGSDYFVNNTDDIYVWNRATGGIAAYFSPNNNVFLTARNTSTDFYMTNTGKIGMGTATPGSTGSALLELKGTAGSLAAGPHFQATTTADPYPLYQNLNWTHGNVSLNFDMYFDGAWRSSYAGPVYQIYDFQWAGEASPCLNFLYGSGAGGGAGIAMTLGMMMNSSGNIGIGTAAPNSHVTITGAGAGYANIGPTGCGGDYTGIALNGQAISGGCGNYNILSSPTDPQLFLNRPTGNTIRFRENNADQMIIASGGKVGIGTTAPVDLLDVNGTAGKPGGGVWVAFSDRRLKQQIQPYTDGLEQVLKINPVTFHYNELSGYDTKPQYVGVVAQELKPVAPYMVGTFTKDSVQYYNVDNSAMTYMLINGMKEQQKMIVEQQKSIDEMKAEIEELKKQITTVAPATSTETAAVKK